MTSQKPIQFTNGAEQALRQFTEDLKERIVVAAREHRFEPGEEFFEVTGGDVQRVLNRIRFTRSGVYERMSLAFGLTTGIGLALAALGLTRQFSFNLSEPAALMLLLGISVSVVSAGAAVATRVIYRRERNRNASAFLRPPGSETAELRGQLEELRRLVDEALRMQTKGSARVSARAPSLQEILSQPTDAGENRSISLPERVADAIRRQDIEQLRGILHVIPEDWPVRYPIASAAALAQNGFREGRDALVRIFRDRRGDLKTPDLRAILAATVRYHEFSDTESDGCKDSEEIASACLEQPDVTAEDRAWILNQLGKLFYGAGRLVRAQELTAKAIDLNPSDPSYMFNMSIIEEKQGRLDAAAMWVDKMLATGTRDADHLAHAVEIYAKSNDKTRAESALLQLRQIDESRAQVAMLSDVTRHAIENTSAGKAMLPDSNK